MDNLIKPPTMAEKWLPIYSEKVANMSVGDAVDYFISSARANGMDHMRIVTKDNLHIGNCVVFADGSFATFYFESASKPGAVLGQLPSKDAK